MNLIERNPTQYSEIFLDICAIQKIKQDRELFSAFFVSPFHLTLSPSIQQELENEGTPNLVKEPIKNITWFTYETPLSDEENKVKQGIKKILQGNAKEDKHKKDALHVFHTAKDGGYFVTTDNRILSKGADITAFLHEQGFGNFKIADFQFIYSPKDFIKLAKRSNLL